MSVQNEVQEVQDSTESEEIVSSVEVTCFWENTYEDLSKNIVAVGAINFLVYYAAYVLYWEKYSKVASASKTYNFYSFQNYITLILASAVRMLLSLIFDQISEKSFTLCQFFAFCDTFMSIFEMEVVAHICIERYVIAKYNTKGWPVEKKHYHLFLFLCLFFAALYSVPPLAGLGRYGYDFTCESCTFDVLLKDEIWDKYLTVTIFFLRGVKPVMVMFLMLEWTYNLEMNYTASMTKKADPYFTQLATTVTFVNLAAWTPISLIRGWVVVSQLLYGEVSAVPGEFYVQWALWSEAIAPSFTALVLLIFLRLRCQEIFDIAPDTDEKIDELKQD